MIQTAIKIDILEVDGEYRPEAEDIDIVSSFSGENFRTEIIVGGKAYRVDAEELLKAAKCAAETTRTGRKS
ncbi:MAG: hypothetical protein NUV58_01420 [Candidatus Roizmanbacteria bacterium]|nr:hypothetical protein [Candidatus Roizmanbacteria bacterium]